MIDNGDLLNRIKNSYTEFSKSQKLIASYIIENYDKAAFMTAAKLARVVNVSESTVVRFATEMGYDGYSTLQNALRSLIRNKLTTIQRMEITSERIGDGDILKAVVQSDIDKLKNTLEEVDEQAFAGAAEVIKSAENIYVLGSRSCYSLANFLGFYLNLIYPGVKVINNNSASETFEQLYRVCESDVVIGISFPRYSKRTQSAIKYAAERNAKIIAITDSEKSPIASYAMHSLIARIDMSSFVDSLVAPLSIINALIVALVIKNKDEVVENFKQLEHIWDEFQVYDKSDNE